MQFEVIMINKNSKNIKTNLYYITIAWYKYNISPYIWAEENDIICRPATRICVEGKKYGEKWKKWGKMGSFFDKSG